MLTEETACRELERAVGSLPAYSGGFDGRGVVIVGGGAKYFPCAWVCINILREHGCRLPIELWHLGPEEVTPQLADLLRPLHVECVNALGIASQRDITKLGGWQLKPFSICHSRFREIIFLDADNFPLVDPAFLFETSQYRDTGAIFWPDYGRLGSDQAIWRLSGIPYRDEPEFETGQIVINKEQSWQPLCLTVWMNEHSDFWYRYVYGDKDTFHVAWRKLGRAFAMPQYGLVALPWTLCQHDFAGRRIFQHRNGAKWTLNGHNPKISGFIEEDRGFAYLEELRVKWTLPVSETIAPIQNDMDGALTLYRAGRLHESEKVCRDLVSQNPGEAAAIHLLGMIAFKTNHHRAALNLLRLSITVAPADAEFHNNLAAVLGELGRHDEAMIAATHALGLKPNLSDAHNNLGVALEHLERFEESTAAYEAAVAISPTSGPAFVHLSNALRKLGRHQAASEASKRAVELMPHSPDAHNGLGVALLEGRKVNEALPAFRQAIQLQPDHIDAHVNRGMALLLSGDYQGGWPEYEWRRRKTDPLWQRFGTPSWYGNDLSERTILVYAEGGLGNSVQFARFAPVLAKRGARVLLECQPPLKALLQTLEEITSVLGRGEQLPAFHEHAPLVSIPGILKMPLNAIPAEVPYLRADPDLVKTWSSRLECGSAFKVGIKWLAEQNTTYGRSRSIPLTKFRALCDVPGVELISLQKGARQTCDFPVTWLQGLDESCGAFVDTAAVMMSLDLVITCDTSIAHVGGALGRPTWVILPYSPDWRWMLDREDSPWYPTIRLFRQHEFGDWSVVLKKIAEELSRFRAELDTPTNKTRATGD